MVCFATFSSKERGKDLDLAFASQTFNWNEPSLSDSRDPAGVETAKEKGR